MQRVHVLQADEELINGLGSEVSTQRNRTLERAGGLRRLIDPAVWRHDALSHDLVRLAGEDWRDSLPPIEAAKRYVDRIKAAGEGDGARLIAHAYVRYLGDLNGGQALTKLLGRSLDDAMGIKIVSYAGGKKSVVMVCPHCKQQRSAGQSLLKYWRSLGYVPRCRNGTKHSKKTQQEKRRGEATDTP
jgi:hypothetical protein